ncbi:MFS transporter [Blastopirellula sp. JC732]|uniref:MFS transporter n=1 Tax=Blastopirellula sediminis TaxID=2894196 RepID=A0A9X1SES9_9BACT|nr:MFS transporter [Blastopirellula sediminis]MCC9608983.1 MFS transporter [Blastopirellula sediminis]MCC9628240.1 MFS transporter [Blastopirellula sediminis]
MKSRPSDPASQISAAEETLLDHRRNDTEIASSVSSEIDERNPRFRRYQWRVLLATMFCYLFFYTGRQTFGFAIPGISEELKITKETLGWASAALLWAYAVGQFINGGLGDRFGGRRMMSLGAILSCGLNWIVSFGTNATELIVPWAANGYAQSMGWAPGSRVLSNWWGHSERGKAYGAYVFAAGMSSVLAFATSMLILEWNLNWRWIFRLPVLLLLVGGVSYYWLVRDKPEELGFTPQRDEELPSDQESSPQEETGFAALVRRYRNVFSCMPFLVAAVAIGFQSMARYGLLIWVPVHFLGEDWKNSDTKWISIALPIGMALGAMASGWISDVWLKGNRSRVIFLFMSAAAACSVAMFLLPKHHPLGIPILFLTGFFAYGPQSAFWALCPDLLGRKNAGTGTGVLNSFAYGFAGFGEPLIGYLIDSSGNTSIIFAVVASACIAGALLSLGIRK